MSEPTMGTTPETLVATVLVAATPEAVFAALTDPTTHAGIHGAQDGTAADGSHVGQVNGAVDTARLTHAGQGFRMAMYHERHPDQDYETYNEVLVYEPVSAVSWRTGYLDDDGTPRFGGWLWRYDLEPTGDGATLVSLTYDWSAATPDARAVIDFPPFGPDHLVASLEHLSGIVRDG